MLTITERLIVSEVSSVDKNFLEAEQNFLSPDYQKIRNKRIPDYFYYLNFKAAEQTAEKGDKKNEFKK